MAGTEGPRKARTWQEFLDAVYKLGLFRED